MFNNARFQKLVEADNLTGEVVSVNSFIVEVKGLEGVRLGAQVLFEDGQHGLVREAEGDRVILFNIDSEKLAIGTLAVVENDVLSVPVGKKLAGRVINPMGKPMDDKGPLKTTETSGIFNQAPGIMARSMLNEQLASGVSAVDMFFPVVLGQRIAILGDSKSGKSTFLSQLSASQHGTDRIVVYVLIGKRKVDIEQLLTGLRESGAMDHTIVVLADIFDSLTQSYLAPYAACAMAEHLWKQGRDVIIIYDDLSSHAEAYRQLSLLQDVDPGRDSYPGDMFYAHSSLLERAGKLKTTNKTLTALPVVLTPNDEVTAYLSTNIMSITDGQIIFDLGLFRQGIRPSVNAGLSVSRVGGQAQTVRQKRLSGTLFKLLARYKQAEEFSHFGSSLSKEARVDLELGKQILEALHQPPEELHTLIEQQLILETVILGGGLVDVDVPALKESAKNLVRKVRDEKDFDRIEADLLKKHSSKPKESRGGEPGSEKPDSDQNAGDKPAEQRGDEQPAENQQSEKPEQEGQPEEQKNGDQEPGETPEESGGENSPDEKSEKPAESENQETAEKPEESAGQQSEEKASEEPRPDTEPAKSDTGAKEHKSLFKNPFKPKDNTEPEKPKAEPKPKPKKKIKVKK